MNKKWYKINQVGFYMDSHGILRNKQIDIFQGTCGVIEDLIFSGFDNEIMGHGFRKILIHFCRKQELPKENNFVYDRIFHHYKAIEIDKYYPITSLNINKYKKSIVESIVASGAKCNIKLVDKLLNKILNHVNISKVLSAENGLTSR